MQVKGPASHCILPMEACAENTVLASKLSFDVRGDERVRQAALALLVLGTLERTR